MNMRSDLRSTDELFDILSAVTDEQEADAPQDICASGWSIYATGPGGTFAAAGGVDALGRVVTQDSLFSVYCAIKPLLAIVSGCLMDRGEMSLNDTIGSIVDCSDTVRDITVEHLLTHRSGCFRPSAVEAMVVPHGNRVQQVRYPAESQILRLAPRESHYSEAAAWLLLSAICDDLLDGQLLPFTRDHVLSPLGLSEHILLSEVPPSTRLRINASHRGSRRLPMLVEGTPASCWGTNPGYGGWSSVRGLVTLYDEVRRARGGAGRVLSPETALLLSTAGEPAFDRNLGRWCSYSPGFMHDLATHRFGTHLSRSAFGHAGLLGMTAIWSDPDRSVSAGYHFTGSSGEEAMIDYLRPALVRLITLAVEG